MRHAGQSAYARQRLNELRDSGAIAVGGGGNPIFTTELGNILQSIRTDVVAQLRNAIEQLEYVDNLLLYNDCRPTILSATLDDVINELAKSEIEMKPSDWVVICMLCDECGKRLTPTQLVNALKLNALTNKKPIAKRESFVAAYVSYTKKSYFPAWPQNTAKEKRYYKIASLIKPLIDVLS